MIYTMLSCSVFLLADGHGTTKRLAREGEVKKIM